jgi:hypothetical protein
MNNKTGTSVFRRAAQGALLSLLLSGCAALDIPFLKPAEVTSPPPAAESGPVPVRSEQTAATLDTTTSEQRKAAQKVVATGATLGTTIASLGSPTEPGFWLKTPLVAEESQGQVKDPATGKAVSVTLIPIDGPATAGSRISLAALRLLDVPLTSLIELDVRRTR